MKLQFSNWSTTFAKLGFKRTGRSSRFRDTNSQLALESLEDRVMLNGSLTTLQFQYVSGASGVASGNFIAHPSSSGYNVVEIDINGDQQTDFSGASMGDVQIAGNLSFGANAVKARATNYMMGGPPGAWQPFTITVTPPANSAPTIASLSFTQGSTTADSASGNLVGTISDGNSYGATIEFDVDRNGSVDIGNVYANGVNFTAPATFPFGPQSINGRVVEYDYVTGQNIIGSWQTLSIANPNPNLSATVTTLGFEYESGAAGIASGKFIAEMASGFASTMVEIDFNGDQQTDFSATSANSTVEIPGSIPFGTHTVKARAKNGMGGGTPGAWQEFTVTVNPPPATAPEISNLSFSWYAGLYGTAIGNFAGYVVDSTATANYVVQLDLDGVTDANGNRDAELVGNSQYASQFTMPGQLTEGEHTIWSRGLEWNNVTGQTLVGYWKQFTIVVEINGPQIPELTYRQNSNEFDGHFSGIVEGFSPYTLQIDVGADGAADFTAEFTGSEFELTGQLGFGEEDVLARAFGYDSQGRYIEDFPQSFKFNLQQPVIPVSTAANVYTGGSTSETQYDLEGTTTTTQTSFWHTSMTSQAMSAGNWSYTGSTSANYTINQDFQSTPTAEDINGGADHVSKNVTWRMDTFGNSLTSISGSGSDLSYTLTTQETATDNSSGTYHLDQSDGIIYDASLSGLDTYSISRFSTTSINPVNDVTTISYTETANIMSLWEFSGEGSYTHEIDEADAEAGTSKHVAQNDWWTDESETSWSDVYTEIATVVIGSDGGESKTGNRLENVNVSQSSGTAWGGSFSYSETFVGQVPLVDPSSEQTPGESPDGTPPVPPPDPVDVPDSADDTVTTISYSEQWTGSQSQNDYESYGDVITFGLSGVPTTSRLGFGGGGYAINLESSSVLSWNQTTGDVESANWSIASYCEDSQADLTVSGGYLSMSNLTIVDGGSDPLTAGITGTYTEDGSDQTSILVSTQGVLTYADNSVFMPDGPTVEPTVTSSMTSVDDFDDTIHILSGDTYNDLVTFSGSDSLTLEHSQIDTYSFALISLVHGTLSLQTEKDYPQSGNSLATFDESYTQTMLLDSGSTTNSSFTVQTASEETTVTLGPITETGTDVSSFAYAATGTSTYHSSETGTYTAPAPSTDPTSGEPIDPNQQVASPFEGLPTLTTIDSNETWTDSLSFSNQSEYEQTIIFNPDDSWSLTRTETGSGDSSFDQTLVSTLTINDEAGSITDGLGTVFTFTESSNLHAWSDGESSYNETLSLVSSAPSDPAETNVPEGETLPPEDPDITISFTHNETGESTSGLTLETTGSEAYQSVGGIDPFDQIESSADWESSFVQNGSGNYELSLAWNSSGFSSYSESGSLLTEYLVTGSSVSEYDRGFDSSVDGMHASSTEHFTASGSELINYAVATQVSVIVPIDDGSGISLAPITTISQSESISVSGNAHAESDFLGLVQWAGDVENTSVAADGSQAIETEGVILDSAIFTQNIFDETYSSTEQISWEYASDTGLTVSGIQTSESEVSGSLDIATDISRITTGADQLSTLCVLTNSFHRTFAGENANSSAYTLTKEAESDHIIAEYLSSSSSSLEVTDTNMGTYQESAPTTDNNHILAPVSDWDEYQHLSKSELMSIEFDGQTWSLAASVSGSLTTNGIYHSTLPDFVAPANTNDAFSYSLNESLTLGTDSAGAPVETHAHQFNFTSSPNEPGEGTYQPSAQMEQLAGNLDTQFKSSAENQANTDGTATPSALSPESQGMLRFAMQMFNGLISGLLALDDTAENPNETQGEAPTTKEKFPPVPPKEWTGKRIEPKGVRIIMVVRDPKAFIQTVLAYSGTTELADKKFYVPDNGKNEAGFDCDDYAAHLYYVFDQLFPSDEGASDLQLEMIAISWQRGDLVDIGKLKSDGHAVLRVTLGDKSFLVDPQTGIIVEIGKRGLDQAAKDLMMKFKARSEELGLAQLLTKPDWGTLTAKGLGSPKDYYDKLKGVEPSPDTRPKEITENFVKMLEEYWREKGYRK